MKFVGTLTRYSDLALAAVAADLEVAVSSLGSVSCELEMLLRERELGHVFKQASTMAMAKDISGSPVAVNSGISAALGMPVVKVLVTLRQVLPLDRLYPMAGVPQRAGDLHMHHEQVQQPPIGTVRVSVLQGKRISTICPCYVVVSLLACRPNGNRRYNLVRMLI